ncbi:MAG TPA: DUF4276 family protein, partial [Longimicrobium sp.]|uniref:DUF4276 family protein n=1 Tax=Longimicrobium sp. TaxID=2029185 RepID=UPI002ED775AF
MLLPIVEGHAEERSIPVLMRRMNVAVLKPYRVKRNSVVKPGELERTLQGALAQRPETTSVLVLLDVDDDCAAKLGPELLKRAGSVTRFPVSVVFAVRELEAWFLGGLESLRGHRGVVADAAYPDDPEQPRGAKERLRAFITGRTYVDTDDQPALMAALDIDAARARCPSLDKLMRDLETMG